MVRSTSILIRGMFTIVLISFMSLFFASNVESALSTNLVGYWSFNSDATDDKGSADGTPTGGASYTTSGCKLGGCYYFDGSDDYISIPSTSLKDSEFTWTVWLYKNGAQPSGYGSWMYNLHGVDGDRLLVSSALLFQYPDCGNFFSDGVTISDSSYYFLSLRRSGTTYTWSVNGVDYGTCSSTAATGTSTINLGQGQSAAAYHLKGYQDEVGYWSRSLSTAELTSLYNSGTGCNPITTNCETPCGAGQYWSSGSCTDVGAGYYSPTADNSRYSCSAGYYGSSTTNSVSTCNGQCTAGYYCTAGSTSATQNACGTGNYCPAGSSGATVCPAGTYGSTTTLTTSSCTGQCSAGYYGSSTGQTAATCNGACTAGYYCTAGSTSATQNVCGTGKYCPAGSSGTTNCAAGYYGSSTTNSVSTCNGACTAGYYCTAGSTSATQNTCTNKPLNSNYNSTSGTNSCGFSCAGDLESKYGCATAGNNTNIHFLNNVSSYSNLTLKVGSKIYLNNSNLTISQLILDGSGDKIIINSGSQLIINGSN